MKYNDYLRQFEDLSDEVLEDFWSRCKEKQYTKGEIITAEGQIQRDMLFVLEGVQMSCYSKDGKMHVIAFTYSPGVSGIPDSFVTQTPSTYSLEALSDSRMLSLSFESRDALMSQYHVVERLTRKLTEAVMVGSLQRYLELRTLTIKERFQIFAERSPHLLSSVPHKYIANYLHISPTNFSKLYNTVKI